MLTKSSHPSKNMIIWSSLIRHFLGDVEDGICIYLIDNVYVCFKALTADILGGMLPFNKAEPDTGQTTKSPPALHSEIRLLAVNTVVAKLG